MLQLKTQHLKLKTNPGMRIMALYRISKSLKWKGRVTKKTKQVCSMFGLTVDRLRERRLTTDCQLEIGEGDVVYITGPSGAGKSILLRELKTCISAADRVDLDEIELPGNRALIDCIEGDLLAALKTLSIAGLNDVFCVLTEVDKLSDGQMYRFRLAMALATGKKFIFADEFCSNLDRITAAIISYNVHRFAKRAGVTFILAASHEDILLDLAPDVLVARQLSGKTEVIYNSARAKEHQYKVR